MHILFIEDNARFMEVVRQQFLANHQVTVAVSLEEARPMLADAEFDAILLDYDLPDGKGVELMEELQQKGLAGRVVAVSSGAENNARLLEAGAGYAVSKMAFHEIARILERLDSQSS